MFFLLGCGCGRRWTPLPAGALRRGEKIWLLAKLPGSIRIRFSEDVSQKYLLLSNSHDGSSCLRIFFTTIRVVCANTLAMADREGFREGIAIRHQGDLPYESLSGPGSPRDCRTLLR